MRNIALLCVLLTLAFTTACGGGWEQDNTTSGVSDSSSDYGDDTPNISDREAFEDALDDDDAYENGAVCWKNTGGHYGIILFLADDSYREGIDTFYDWNARVLDTTASRVAQNEIKCSNDVLDVAAEHGNVAGFCWTDADRDAHEVGQDGELCGIIAVKGRYGTLKKWDVDDTYVDDNGERRPTNFGEGDGPYVIHATR